MKFPVAFRVFATLNVLLFLILFLQSFLFYSMPDLNAMGMIGTIVSTFAGVWLLVVAFYWFFGSARSYPLLYLTALVVVILGVTIFRMGYLTLRPDENSERIIFFSVYALICTLYAVFLVFTFFFKPVKEWYSTDGSKSKTFHWLLFAGVAVGTSAVFLLLNRFDTRYIVTSVPDIRTWDDNTQVMDCMQLSEFDAVLISHDETATSLKAVVAYSTNWEASAPADFFRYDTLTFKPVRREAFRKDELNSVYWKYSNFIAHIKPTKARRVKITILEGSTQVNGRAYALLHTVPHFDRNTSSAQFIAADDVRPNSEEEGSGMGRAGIQTDEELITEGMRPLDEAGQQALITYFVNQLCTDFDNIGGYDFNGSNARIIINGKGFGTYRNFAYTFNNYAPALFQQLMEESRREFYDGESSLNDMCNEATGVPLYNEGQGLPFKELNPYFVNWLRAYMVPATNQQIYDVTTQQIYNHMFRRMVWMLAAAHEYLTSSDAMYDNEVDVYRQKMSEEGFNGVQYLYDRYGTMEEAGTPFQKVSAQFPYGNDDYYYFDQEEAIGFWLRRRMDGSDDEVYNLLNDILTRYDNYAYEGAGN